jgi:hypothetical protein
LRSSRRGFAALRNRNFRLYLLGQTVSQAGTWMQTVAQAWLVLHLTDSGTALGVVIALQALPVLLFAPLGGVLNLPPMAGHLPEDGGGCWDGIWWSETEAVFGGVQA